MHNNHNNIILGMQQAQTHTTRQGHNKHTQTHGPNTHKPDTWAVKKAAVAHTTHQHNNQTNNKQRNTPLEPTQVIII